MIVIYWIIVHVFVVLIELFLDSTYLKVIFMFLVLMILHDHQIIIIMIVLVMYINFRKHFITSFIWTIILIILFVLHLLFMFMYFISYFNVYSLKDNLLIMLCIFNWMIFLGFLILNHYLYNLGHMLVFLRF